MKKYSITIFLFLFSCMIYGQDETYNYENYFIKISDSTLKAFNSDSTLFCQKKFSDPKILAVDLDSDEVNEIVIIDNRVLNGIKRYTLYVYNTLDNTTDCK